MAALAHAHRGQAPLGMAIAWSFALHALAAGFAVGPGRTPDRILEPARAVPLRLVAVSSPVDDVKPVASTVPQRRPTPLEPHVHPHSHAHPHPHPQSRLNAPRTSVPKAASSVEQRPLETRSAGASPRASTPVPHGDAPMVRAAPLEPEVAQRQNDALAPQAPALASTLEQTDERALVIQTPVAAPAQIAPTTLAAVTPVPPGSVGDANRIEPPHYKVAYLKNPKPEYPPVARRLRLEGEVIVRAMVDPAGRASELKIQSSSGAELLDEAALRAVREYRFVPAKRGNEAVTHWVDIPFAFRLSD